jgi:hypothetical protein
VESSTRHDRYLLMMTRDELMLLKSALNEVLNGIDVPEFETRLGATHDEAYAVMQQIRRILGSSV